MARQRFKARGAPGPQTRGSAQAPAPHLTSAVPKRLRPGAVNLSLRCGSALLQVLQGSSAAPQFNSQKQRSTDLLSRHAPGNWADPSPREGVPTRSGSRCRELSSANKRRGRRRTYKITGSGRDVPDKHGFTPTAGRRRQTPHNYHRK